MVCHIDAELLPLKLFHLFQFAVYPSMIVYLSPFMISWGVTVTEIALIQIFTQILTLFSRPFFGYIADKYQNYKNIIIFLSIISGIGFMLFLACPKYVQPIDKYILNRDFIMSGIFNYNSLIICGLNNSSSSCWPTSLVQCSYDSSTIYDLSISHINSTCGIYQALNQSQFSNLPPEPIFKCKNIVRNCNLSDTNVFTPVPKNYKLTGSAAFWLLGFLKVFTYTLYSPLSSLGDSLIFMVLGPKRAYKYGFTRMFGTIGVLIFSILTGICLQSVHLLASTFKWNWLVQVQSYSPFTICFILQIIVFVCIMLDTHFIKYSIPNEEKQSTKGKSCLSNFASMMSFDLLFKNAQMTTFFIFTLFGGFALAVQVEYYIVIMYKMFPDLPKYVPGLLIATEVSSESLFIGFSSKILKHLSHEFVITIGFFAWSIRWFLYFFCKTYWQFLILELIHGVSYGLQITAMVSFVGKFASPTTQGRSQGLISAVYYNLGGGFGGLIGGIFLGQLGSSVLFLFMFVMCLLFGISYYPLQVWIIPRYFNKPTLNENSNIEKGNTLLSDTKEL